MFENRTEITNYNAMQLIRYLIFRVSNEPKWYLAIKFYKMLALDQVGRLVVEVAQK